jgi:hypothetical protein
VVGDIHRLEVLPLERIVEKSCICQMNRCRREAPTSSKASVLNPIEPGSKSCIGVAAIPKPLWYYRLKETRVFSTMLRGDDADPLVLMPSWYEPPAKKPLWPTPR